MNLEFGLGQAHPAHRAEMITAFPGAEDLFDSCPDRLERAIMRFKRFRLKPAMTLAQKLCDSAASFACRLDRKRIIGLIAIHLAGLLADHRRTKRAIVLICRGRLDLADDARVLMGGDMRLISMRGPAALVFCPGGLAVALGCRSDDGRGDQPAFAPASALSFKTAPD